MLLRVLECGDLSPLFGALVFPPANGESGDKSPHSKAAQFRTSAVFIFSMNARTSFALGAFGTSAKYCSKAR